MFIRLPSSQKAIVGLFLCSSLLLTSGCEGGSAGTGTIGTSNAGAGGDVASPDGGAGGGGGGGDGGGIDIPDLNGGGGGFTGDTPGGGGTTPPPGGGGGGDVGGMDAVVAADANNGLIAVNFTGAPNASGVAQVFADLQNATSFQLVTVATGRNLATLALEAPNGEVVVSTRDTQLKTTAVILGPNVNTLPYQTRGADPEVVNGRYVQGLFIDAPGTYQGTLIAKNDADTSRGNLVVNVFLVGDSAQTGSSRTAVNSAIALWRTIYAQIGITLDIMIFDVDSDNGVVPNPSIGSSFYLNNITAANVRPFALNVFIGDSVSEDDTTVAGNELPVLGVASAIPGPAIATIQSAVAISLGQHAGADGSFSDDDEQLLGETIAHEGGHYLGLFHPVENDFVTGGFTDDDPLADTPVCTTSQGCISNGLAMNNMFPRPVPNVLQQNFTPNQGEVVNLQVLVN